ncbi:hypothetical protein PPL_04683 [Heterostelium album PN500]|uniref:Uncharacterized protein n=1 Tax=Heterostelium pallidum (strain ATCC 26659 / Pp 5 / PN500) TaxID=670386 RepID=D3B892_HETP5|nr:hypothetical protein PPL_04683 [Heterostelium album PN500]EFA82260.1 hypothetical protein PPL_04683 [Heterostelium album PN500]|eukprot:XP_020434377.1 hypothetical protein PPL_04683 [Heterostelium album PN500]
MFKDNYELLVSTKLNHLVVEKWRSKRTGLTVYNVKAPNPLVHCQIFLATETHSHDGCPHTLEHLIFLGSEDYPYKGFLDLIASKSFANGTNAWTSTDHTSYTLSTAGSEGFLQALPIFMDHILYPTITDEAFHTEVHHIDGEGKDAGVVYSEMQARENERFQVIDFESTKYLFKNDSGYKYETGGRLEDLRSLNVETVRKYHRDYYRPENTGVFIAGNVDAEQIFEALESVEQKIMRKRGDSYTPLERPWQTESILFDKSITKEIFFKSEDDTKGDVHITFKSANANDHTTTTAMEILLEYLMDGSSAPIMQQMIDIKDAYAASVSNYIYHYKTNLANCDLDKIRQVRTKMMEVLTDLVENKSIDLEKIRTQIQLSKLKFLSQLETDLEELLSQPFITDLLYFDSPQDLVDSLNTELYEVLAAKDQSYWIDLLKTYFIDQPFVEIIGLPSLEEGDRLTKEDNDRTQAQIEQLGQEKLAELAKELDRCQAVNTVQVDQHLFVQSILNDKPLVNDDQHKKINEYIQSKCSEKVPFDMLFSNGDTAFVSAILMLNTYELPDELRGYLPLYADLMELSPVVVNGVEIDHESMDLMYKQVFFSNAITIENYEKAVALIHDILYNVKFVKERIDIVANQLLDEIPEEMDNAQKMLNSLRSYFEVDHTRSNEAANNVRRQQVFLEDVIARLEDDATAQSEFASLMFLCTYFDQFEGPFFKGLRGAGICYSFSLDIDREKCVLQFNCIKAANIESALKEAKKIVLDIVESGTFRKDWVQTARSTLVFDIAKKEKDITSAMIQQLWSVYIRKWPIEGYKLLLDILADVTEEDLLVSMKYFRQLFDDNYSYVGIVSDPTKVESLKQLFDTDKLKVVDIESKFV